MKIIDVIRFGIALINRDVFNPTFDRNAVYINVGTARDTNNFILLRYILKSL
jgi:hypothetical protein